MVIDNVSRSKREKMYSSIESSGKLLLKEKPKVSDATVDILETAPND